MAVTLREDPLAGRLRICATAALTLSGILLVPGVAHAATGTLYVNNADLTVCSDTGPGTSATPFCTLQAAADAATAGQTVSFAGSYAENLVISHSGTQRAPIVFTSDSINWSTVSPADPARPTVTVSGGTHDVVFTGVNLWSANAGALLVKGGNRITFTKGQLSGGYDNHTIAVVEIGANARAVTISNNLFGQAYGPDVRLAAGNSGAVIAGNSINAGGTGIIADAVTGAAIVNNTLMYLCNQGVLLTGQTTATTVENNIIGYINNAANSYYCAAQDAPAAGLVVDATAAAGVVARYNSIRTVADGVVNYRWAGTSYPDAASFAAGTGQGAHDFDGDPGISPGAYYPYPNEGAEAIDSADAAAPGVPTLSIYDQARVDDPLVDNSGAGPYPYLDRGAFEYGDSFVDNTLTAAASQAPVGAAVRFTGDFTDAWSEAFSCAFTFGDGRARGAGPCTASHAYSAPGTYQVTVTATNAAKLSSVLTATVTVVPAGGSLTPTLDLPATGALGVTAAVTAGSDPWNIASVSYDFGDGGTPVATSRTSLYHAYTEPGSYRVTATVTDAKGTKKSVAHWFTTAGTDFRPIAPVRLRDSAAAAIAAHGTVSLQVGGVGGIPTGITAVALNLTAVGPTAAGTVSAWAGGAGPTSTTNLRFAAGQTTSAESFVAVGPGGVVKLANDSGAALVLTADVVGYFSTSADGDRHRTITPVHLADSRSGLGLPAGQLPPGTARTVQVAGAVGLPASGIDAVSLVVTARNAASAGALTVYPTGSTAPGQASLTYPAGAPVAGSLVVPVSAAGAVDLSVSTAADVVVDVTGYFARGSGETYVPVTPVRAVDSAAAASPIPAHEIGYFSVTNGIANLSRWTGTVVGTVTVTPTGSGPGELAVFESTGAPAPDTYQVYWSAGRATSTPVLAQVLSGYNGVVDESFVNDSDAPVNVTFDVFGYFAYTYS